MRQIVIATDGSPAAREAVDFGLELAGEYGAEVTFVHVVPPDEFVVAARMARPIPHPEPVDENEAALLTAAEQAEQAGIPHTLERISDNTVHAILGVAEEKNADLIVVGSRGRGALTSTLLGSVSRRLVQDARRPVLVVKAARERVPAQTT